MKATKKEVRDYAWSILTNCHCDKYSYGGTDGETIIRDLKEGFPDGLKYPYVDVANAIIDLSRVRHVKRATWHVIWDNDNCCAGYDCPSLEYAKSSAEDTLLEWMVQARHEWADIFHPTEDELDDYNYMINSCGAYVAKYNPDTDEYEEYWWPDEEEIGWKELTMEDVAKEEQDYLAGLQSRTEA